MIDDHLRGFAKTLEHAIARHDPGVEKNQRARQRRQFDTLTKAESDFRKTLSTHRDGPKIYRDFCQYIIEVRHNLSSARPFFRERQDVFKDRISDALRRRDVRILMKFAINYNFCHFTLAARKWSPKSKVVKQAAAVLAARTELVEANLPLALNRTRIFWGRTRRGHVHSADLLSGSSHLDYMDLVQIAADGLVSAVDKFVVPKSKNPLDWKFAPMAIGRVTGNLIESFCLDQDTILEPCNQRPKPIKDFHPGDQILAVDEKGQTIATEVVALHDNGFKEAFKITFEGGYSVTCSAKHKFLTPVGMKSLASVVDGGLEVFCEPAEEKRWLDDQLRDSVDDQEGVGRTSQLLSLQDVSSAWRRDVVAHPYGLFRKQKRHSSTPLDPMAYANAPLTSTGGLVRRRVVRVVALGARRMYDLEVAHPKHNFLLPNGIVTSNSSTLVHFPPMDRRKLYRSRKVLARGGEVGSEQMSEINSGLPIKARANHDEISQLVSASVCSSADVRQSRHDGGDEETMSETFVAPETDRPDLMVERSEALETIGNAIVDLPLFHRKMLRLRGVDIARGS